MSHGEGGVGAADVVDVVPQLKPGDANHDYRFKQLDIVAVLATGKYLTGRPARWSEGDWTDDGFFDLLDIIAALETGNYLAGPYAAADGQRTSLTVVPEPATALLTVVGCLFSSLLSCTRRPCRT